MKRIISAALMCSVILYNVVLSGTFLNVAYAKESAKTNKQEAEKMYKEYVKPNLNHNEDEHSEEKFEEVEQMDKEYESFVMELPKEKVEWSVNHEKNIGISDNDIQLQERSVMTLSSNTVYYEKKTNDELVGDMNKVMDKQFADGITGYTFSQQLKSTFVLPGMKSTAVRDEECIDMVPQGILYYNGYIYITAYCSEGEHNSVIYVIKANSKKYITTLVTDHKSHMSGIEYADGYLWICQTLSDEDRGQVYYYDYSKIESYIQYTYYHANVGNIDISGCKKGSFRLNKGDKASFVVQYNGYLAFGEFEEDALVFHKKSYLNFYKPSKLLAGEYTPYYSTEIPSESQGISFYRANSRTYAVISTSNGRLTNSRVYIYKSEGISYSSPSLRLTYEKTITMPCMVEESIVYNGYTYFVFESCARKYRDGTEGIGKATYVIGNVCGFSNNFIFK